MTTVLAALDNTAAARPVLAVAAALAELLDGEVAAVHAREDRRDRAEGAAAAAAAADVPIRFIAGPVTPTLLAAGRAADVVALVLGAHRVGSGRRPAGHVALELAVSLPKPLVVVPPDVPTPSALRRVLVPLDGSPRTAATLEGVMHLAASSPLEIVVLHVYEADAIPLFSDQRQYELEAWAWEFLHRHCPHPEQVALEVRTGVPGEQVLNVAREDRADLIALGWSQDLSVGHAAVVRGVLERSTLPTLLIPLGATPLTGRMQARGARAAAAA